MDALVSCISTLGLSTDCPTFHCPDEVAAEVEERVGWAGVLESLPKSHPIRAQGLGGGCSASCTAHVVAIRLSVWSDSHSTDIVGAQSTAKL